MNDEARSRIHVVAGVLYDANGRVLIAQRPAGKVLAGRWEFPGGKLHDGEDMIVGTNQYLERHDATARMVFGYGQEDAADPKQEEGG